MRTLTAIMLGVAGFAAPAQAQDETVQRPQPGCAGVNFTDPRGDVDNAGLDIVSGFLTTDGDDVFANLVVTNLDRRVDQPDMTTEWFVASWTTDEGSDGAAAHLRSDGTTDGGSFFEGENGVVQLRLPGVTPTTPIRLWAHSGADRDPTVVGLDDDSYVALDLFGQTTEEIEGSVQTASCPAAAPQSANDHREQPTRATAPRAAATELLATRVSGRIVRLRLRSASPTAVRAVLSRAGRVVARGAARVDGTGTLVLTARRSLRAGTYTLRIAGVGTQRLEVRGAR